MALETDINLNESLVFNGEFSGFVENGQILLLNEPLMIYTQENIDNDCAIVLDPISDENSQNLNLPEIIFDGNYFQFENLQNNNFQNDFELHDDFQYLDERRQVDDGLAVLEILYNNNNGVLDQPEFIDVDKLTVIDHEPQQLEKGKDRGKQKDVLLISDDDDVVFVREYVDKKKEKQAEQKLEAVSKRKSTDNGIRRNPVRKVRTRSKNLSKELIFEEDFAFLDTSEEDDEDEDKENKIANKKSPPPSETFKQWPVNVHERPEYNTETKQIEAFDYTIREIQKKPANKKPRLETVTVRRKSKKKYFTRKRKPRAVEVKKVPIEDVKPLVNSTTELLRDFFKNCKEVVGFEGTKLETCSLQKKLDVLKTQAILYCLVNDLDEDDVLKKLDQRCITECEAKE